jgi:hypothetical protein
MKPGDLVRIELRTSSYMDDNPIASAIGLALFTSKEHLHYWVVMFPSGRETLYEKILEVISETG